MSATCRIKGPYYLLGDIDWECAEHGLVLVRNCPAPLKPGHDHRRSCFACPVETPQDFVALW